MRYYLLARCAFAKPLSLIATPNPITLVKLFEMAQARREEIIRSIHNGWISDAIKTPAEREKAGLPASLSRLFRPDRARARFLSSISGGTNAFLPMQIWPDLSVIGCWLGGSIGYQAGLLDERCGGVSKRDLGYMASEGVFTLTTEDETPAGILSLRNNYYEFIPAEDDGSGSAVTADELEAGRSYRMIITNEMGLYRYDLNDIIQVHGFHKDAPLISFVRKGGNMLDIAGEKLHVNHFLFAFDRLRKEHQVDVTQFRAVRLREHLRYELFLAIRPQVDREFVRSVLLPVIDTFLSESNIEYGSRRRSDRLKGPIIHMMALEWEDHVRGIDLARRGRSEVQYKWEQLSTEPRAEDRAFVLYSVE